MSIERFNRILLEEWAYLRPWHSEAERTAAYRGFCHFYNHHRSHGSLGWATPMGTLARLAGDNVPGMHNKRAVGFYDEKARWILGA